VQLPCSCTHGVSTFGIYQALVSNEILKSTTSNLRLGWAPQSNSVGCHLDRASAAKVMTDPLITSLHC
jgi:hypothetical protein